MKWITADFPHLSPAVRDSIVAGCTTRSLGASKGPYEGLNLALHVNDNKSDVYANRAILRDELPMPNEPYWLKQTHSVECMELPYEYRESSDADASYTALPEHVCIVQTADCLPVLIVDSSGQQVAAIHAGWRGLADAIISKTVHRLDANPEQLHVWMGPAISQTHFEVGPEVKQAFESLNAANQQAFKASVNAGKYMADIFALARNELVNLGVSYISGGGVCTFSNPQAYYSYRRDGVTGRQASFIWKK